MYLTLPLCYLLARRGVGGVLGLLALGIGGALLWKARVIPGLWRLSVLEFVPCFASGVLAYALLCQGAFRRKIPGAAWPVLLIALGTAYWATSRHGTLWWQWSLCVAILICDASIKTY